MKIKATLCCFLFACMAFVLTACGSGSTLQGDFEKDEYVLSFGESVDFRQNFSYSGFELDSLTFNFSNSEIFQSLDNGSYQAVGYGKTEVFAYVGNEVVATTSVFVTVPLFTDVSVPLYAEHPAGNDTLMVMSVSISNHPFSVAVYW